jgi:hypothetical protein
MPVYQKADGFGVLGMSFELDGFFSAEAEEFRRYVRETQPFKVWIEYALRLNRLGFDMLRTVQTALSDNRQIALNAHFVRVHQSLQSALILAERGLIPDARVVLRSATEGAIAVNALAKDGGFVDQMIEAHYRSRRTMARVMLDKFTTSFSVGEISNMNAAIAEADTYQASKGSELTDIKWEQVAERHCPELYHLFYRDLSSDGAHATLSALDRFFNVDAKGDIIGFKVAPDVDGLVDVLSAASLLFIWSAGPYAETNGLTDAIATISEHLKTFKTLPGADPRAIAASP